MTHQNISQPYAGSERHRKLTAVLFGVAALAVVVAALLVS